MHGMTFSNTASLEHELAPAVVQEIRATAEQEGTSLGHATAIVAMVWFDRAIAEGFHHDVAYEAYQYVRRVGTELRRGERS